MKSSACVGCGQHNFRKHGCTCNKPARSMLERNNNSSEPANYVRQRANRLVAWVVLQPPVPFSTCIGVTCARIDFDQSRRAFHQHAIVFGVRKKFLAMLSRSTQVTSRSPVTSRSLPYAQENVFRELYRIISTIIHIHA